MEIPANIGKYHQLEVAGSGNTATVFRAHDPFCDRAVALKLCHQKLNSPAFSRLAKKLFFNEAHAAGALVHPNIVQVLDAGEHHGSPYLVMEYVDGAMTLEPHCEASNLLHPRAAAQVVFHAAKALEYSHRNGVVHRDVKPSNILIGRDGRSRLTDFGIAQYDSQSTQLMGVMGSPSYMSPEQVLDQPLGPQTDVYSLGVVLYELLSATRPFTGTTLAGLTYSIVHESPREFVSVQQTPPGVGAVIACALDKDPARRYQSIGEMAEAIEHVFDGLDDTSDMALEDKLAYLKQLAFFSAFDESELAEVVAHGEWSQHCVDDRIVVEGSMDLSFYIVISGYVVVQKSDQAICRLEAGQCFGEMGYLSLEKRNASIIAGSPVLLLGFTAASIRHTSAECRLRFQEAFIRTLISRLASTSESLLLANQALSQAARQH